MLQKVLVTTALVSPMILMSGFVQTATAEIACDDSESLDCIIITQDADSKGIISNSSTVVLDGEATAILPVATIAQSGDNNQALFDIVGSYNTIYFAQVGNALTTMVIDGDRNMVTLNEFGGNVDREAGLDVLLTGDDNDLEISAAQMYAVAQLLEIDLSGANHTVMRVDYDDFATIVADVVGDGGDITINQNNGETVADEANANTISFFLNSSNGSNLNKVNLSQYGVRNNIAMTINGEGSFVEVNQMNGYSLSSSLDLFADVAGQDNETRVEQWASQEGSAINTTMDVVGNGNTIAIYDGEHLAGSTLIISGSNNVATLWHGNQSLNINGSDNSIYQDTSSDPNSLAAGDIDVNGDMNTVNVVAHLLDDGLSVTADIYGSFNSVNMDGDSHGIEGSDHRSIDVSIVGDENSIEQTGFLNRGSSGMNSTDYIDFDVDGSFNTVSFGAINSIGLNADIIGDGNSFTATDTDNLTASITGFGNGLSIVSASSNNLSRFSVLGDENSLSFSNLHTDDLDVSIWGSRNTASVSGVNELSLNLTLSGDGNSYTQNMQDIYYAADFAFDVHVTVEGFDNSVDVVSVPEYAYSNLFLEVFGYDNQLLMTGVGADYMVAASSVDVNITGDANDVSVHAGSTVDLDLTGSNYAMSVNYDTDLGVYLNHISDIGSGNVTLTTPDGRVSVSAL